MLKKAYTTVRDDINEFAELKAAHAAVEKHVPPGWVV